MMFKVRFLFCCRYLLAALAAASTGTAVADDCESFGDYSYLCGPVSAEDLVLVPDTDWLIASGFGGEASMYFIDAREKSWTELYPDDALRAEHDKASFPACPGPPDSGNLVAHGLAIRAGEEGHATLYVVGHGAREAIEVFDVDSGGDVPEVTWIGCVPTPDSMEANSVAAFADGSLLVTIPLHTGFSIETIFAGIPTGAVYSWAPGEQALVKVDGTEMGYANGIETSADGAEFYVASSAHWKVYAFSNTNPARQLRETERLSFVPDNLHMGRDGKLLTAGLETSDPDCGVISMTGPFDLGVFASCNRAFTVLAIDPESMSTTVRASSVAHPKFSNVTMAVEAGDALWIGTFAGDRIAYLSTEDAAD